MPKSDAPSAPEGLIYGYLERDNEKVFKLYVNNSSFFKISFSFLYKSYPVISTAP